MEETKRDQPEAQALELTDEQLSQTSGGAKNGTGCKLCGAPIRNVQVKDGLCRCSKCGGSWFAR